MGKILVEDIVRRADPKEYSIPFDDCPAINAKKKEEERDHLLLHLSYAATAMHAGAGNLTSWEVAGHDRLMVNTEYLVYFCFHVWPLLFLY